MEHLSTLSNNKLEKWLNEHNSQAYRRKQIFSWIFERWLQSPLEMQNIPKELREELNSSFASSTSKITDDHSTDDMTDKILIELADGESIENVIIRTEDRTTFCLSSQIGCAVQCHFCASGLDGLIRNLTAEEIIEHLLICCRKANSRPDNIVFMGIGEPLMNIENLIQALDIISSPERFAFSPRRITISTSGWVPGIIKLANIAKPYNLALSLHGTDDTIRAQLIPEKCRYPLSKILEACCEYRNKTRRMITFEYTLLKGVNDSYEQAQKLAQLARKQHAKVNLIPFNTVAETKFIRPDDHHILSFLKILTDNGIQATCRLKKGNNINAACGQLRRSQKNQKQKQEQK